jgi:hypothetical protein
MLEDSPPTFVYFHLIMASKFSMPPTSHSLRGLLKTYEPSIEVLGLIQKGVAS